MLNKMSKDLEEVKKEVADLKMIILEDELELTDETKRRIEESRERMARGEYISDEEMRKEFGLA